MCGIAGLFHLETPKPVDPARIRVMTDAQAHRGPDGSDVWTAPGVGLGHRRLSIIDVAGSPQPMSSADGAVTISFNGEIYNYADIRADLKALGHQFRTAGDTEVILLGYRQWGVDVLRRLNGMFAFAIHDLHTRTLLIARDRMGVKPLHYMSLPDGSVAFASELKGLLANPAVRRAPDVTAIEDYFALGYVPDDASLVAGVKKLPAGHYLHLALGKPMPAPTQWWDIDFSKRVTGSQADLEHQLRELLRTAVTSRMVADVPLGAFLSGGVDSSAVVALMAERSAQAVETCSIGFDHAALDETVYADQIAARFATRHRKRIVASDDFAAIDTLVRAFDEPFADASALPTYRVCQLARETVTVALSGDGADEAFAGYRRYRFQAVEERVRAMLPAGLRQPVFGTLGRLYPKADWAPQYLRAKSTFQSLARDGAEAYARSVGVLTPEMRQSIYSDSFTRSLQGHRAEDRYITVMTNAPARDGLDRAQYADIKIWLPGDILTKVDRASMAVSLEAREPLLDHRLVEFAASLPPEMRLCGGEGKWLMKKAMEGHLPRDILYRKKMGFVTPVTAWFRGPLAADAMRVIETSTLSETGWLNRDRLAGLARDHKAGIADHGRLLWQLVMLDKSLRHLFG
ncbi:MAG: XrtA/PEP-CTERM system amidotransferase [Sphingomonadaceae bacterium]